MKCYKCEAELTEQKFCTNCLADVELYKKIVGMSNFFYNSGLEKAKIRDLSGAIVALKESLKFDKKNINARNLLGLVYFEIGEVTEALTQWIISSNIRGKKNMATEYIDRLGANQSKLNAAADIIKKYNAALASCKQPDGDDLGSIQLKALLGKAPNFLRAFLHFSSSSSPFAPFNAIKYPLTFNNGKINSNNIFNSDTALATAKS